MSTTTGYRHVEISGSGVPVIAGTGYKVVPLIEQYKARGWTAEELQQHYPDLTPAQLHSVLAYYHDHAREIDAAIRRRATVAEDVRHRTPSSPVAARLRALRQANVP